MFIGKVVGTVVSSVKDPKVAALKFQVVQELDEWGKARSRYVVAVDTVGDVYVADTGRHRVVRLAAG